MIGKLKGRLTDIEGNTGLIETSGGVFYKLFLTPAIIKNHPSDDMVEFYTYLQVRDDALVLFGFETKIEHDFFIMLLTVPGVGPKTAYSVISYGNIEEIINAVKNNDINFFSRIPGLGKKTTMKIMLELSQKLKQEFKLEAAYLSEEDKTVIDALVSLGFKSSEAHQILSKIPKNLSVEEKIREALQITNKHK